MTGQHSWVHELRRGLAVIATCALAGWFAGAVAVGTAVGALVVLGFWVWQLWRIRRWLADPESEPPETIGLWGVIFDNIYALQRRNREAQSRLESALDYLQDSLASMRDAAVIVDVRGNIAWANDSSRGLLGLNFPADRGQPVLNLIRVPRFHEYFAAEDYGEPLRLPPAKEGERCLQFEVSRFGEGDRLLFVRDVTETYRLEQMRRDFVGNVSHELRTPLTVIKGYIDTLPASSDHLDPRIERALSQMGEQVVRMETLLRDLLWLARIESIESRSKHSIVNMVLLLDELVDELKAGYPTRKVLVDVTSTRRLVGDQMELHSAVSNLVINALKYSASDSPVSVRYRDDGEGVMLEVEDRGVGIDAIHIPRLTERFYRVDKSRSQSTGGTGLGLAIVKHVAAAHGAELRIDSEPGVGSCFALVFPASAIASAA